MLYADPSYLVSLYAWDGNTDHALAQHTRDGRRPYLLTPWSRLELRNTIRRLHARLTTAGQPTRFQVAPALQAVDNDLRDGLLHHAELDERRTFRRAEQISARLTPRHQLGAVDVWHLASALELEAQTFLTFDQEQAAAARTLKLTAPALRPEPAE